MGAIFCAGMFSSSYKFSKLGVNVSCLYKLYNSNIKIFQPFCKEPHIYWDNTVLNETIQTLNISERNLWVVSQDLFHIVNYLNLIFKWWLIRRLLMINLRVIDEVWPYWIFWLDLIVTNNIQHYHCLALLTTRLFRALLPLLSSRSWDLLTINTDWTRPAQHFS